MSYAIFSAKNVEKACRAWLKWLDDDIAATKEAMITKAMKPRWLGRTRTREEAIKWCSTSDRCSLSDFELAEMYLWRDKEDIMALLALSMKATSDVRVSANDAYILREFL